MGHVQYFLLILVGIIIISLVIIFILRKNKVGHIVISVPISNVRFIWLIGGIFMIILGLDSIYLGLFIKKITIYPFNWISPIMTGVLFLMLFSTSTVFIGFNGVSFSYLPFYVPLNQLSSYTLEGNRLILKRNEIREYEISIKSSDVNKVVNAMNQLAIKKN